MPVMASAPERFTGFSSPKMRPAPRSVLGEGNPLVLSVRVWAMPSVSLGPRWARAGYGWALRQPEAAQHPPKHSPLWTPRADPWAAWPRLGSAVQLPP